MRGSRQSGASPDAGRRRLGAVEFAHRGTLFLDNIDALPPSLQPDVLAYLQGVSVGSARGRCVPSLDVRTLMATRGSLGSGRDELRLPQNSAVLSVLDFQLAPLRARPGHIAPLAEFFLARFNAWYGRDAWLPREGLRRLTDYAWPGNVRELKGEIRRFVLSAEPHPETLNTVSLFRLNWKGWQDLTSDTDVTWNGNTIVIKLKAPETLPGGDFDEITYQIHIRGEGPAPLVSIKGAPLAGVVGDALTRGGRGRDASIIDTWKKST